MTLQTDIAQIQALCDKILKDAEQGTPEPPEPEPETPIDGAIIISVYDYKSPYIEINIARNEGWLSRDFLDELNEAAKECGGIVIRQACPQKGQVFTGSPAHTDAGDRVDLYYPMMDGDYDRDRLYKFVKAMDRQRPKKMEYVMDISLEGFMKQDRITYVDYGNHDSHYDVYRGIDK
jgi:hypothetical protein